MSSSSPVGYCPDLPFDPTIHFGLPGSQPDFTTVFRRHRDRGDCRLPPVFDPDGCGHDGSGEGCRPTGGGHLSVNGDTISDGQYTIDASTADSGTIKVTDSAHPNETFTVWGDPHIKTGTGGTANFQHAPVTFKLPDGTEITITPTDNTGVNTIKDVAITSGHDEVTITGFKSGHLDIDNVRQDDSHPDMPPEGTIVRAKDGNINDLMVGDGGPEIYKTNVGNIDRYASLSVDGPGGDTVYDGRYTIVASDADHGTLTVMDNVTKETFTVWGDPHIKTSADGTASFQHAPVTFALPDGTKITVTPTDNEGPHSVNTIDRVTITKGNEVVTITGFKTGHLDTDLTHRNCNTPPLQLGTVLRVKDGNIDDLVVGNGGPEIYKTSVGNIDRYAGGWPLPHPRPIDHPPTRHHPVHPVSQDDPTDPDLLWLILANNSFFGSSSTPSSHHPHRWPNYPHWPRVLAIS